MLRDLQMAKYLRSIPYSLRMEIAQKSERDHSEGRGNHPIKALLITFCATKSILSVLGDLSGENKKGKTNEHKIHRYIQKRISTYFS